MRYTNKEGKKIHMVQTYADRCEWGVTYHIVEGQRALRRVIKVYGSCTHPVQPNIVEECIHNTINSIIDLKPDIVGLGGNGLTAERISDGLEKAGCEVRIDYWGHDVGNDAAQFLKRYGVAPPY